MQSGDTAAPARPAREGWIAALAGLAWIWPAPQAGVIVMLLCLVPGSLLLAGGLSMLLMRGDRRIAQWTAAGGVAGVLLSLPVAFAFGLFGGLGFLAISLAGVVAAGWHSLATEPRYADVPEAPPSPRVAAQVAIDEALLAELVHRVGVVEDAKIASQVQELHEARGLFRERGWIADPASYHQVPEVPSAVSIERRAMGRVAYEHLSFPSEYEPYAGEPGRERWLGYERNRNAGAWVVRTGADRPWLYCVHGFMMGFPRFDFGVFRPDVFADKLGLNMVIPTLPLHGRRAHGWRSGDGFFSADILDTIHAEAQAMWDLRRVLGWVRTQTEQPIGVYGVSLGGYNAALLASLEDDLACVVAGVPVADLSRIVFRHGPAPMLNTARATGMQETDVRELQRVISPLALTPRVPLEHRHIFAGWGDRIVPPDHPRDLWRHWEEPEITWYPGAHVTFLAFEKVRAHLRRALDGAGLLSAL